MVIDAGNFTGIRGIPRACPLVRQRIIKINPKTDCIDVDTYKNTKVQIWLECGPYKDERPVHDIDLDCGGDSFEEAIINLAKLVQEKCDE